MSSDPFMQYAPKGFHYIYKWRMRDPNACDQCRRLNGKEWRDQDLFGSVIWDEIEGDVWNLDIGQPLTHGGTGANCRCTVEVKVIVDLSEIKSINDLGIILETPTKEKIVTEDVDLSLQLDALRKQVDDINEKASKLEAREPSLREDVRLLNLLMMDLTTFAGNATLDDVSQKMHQVLAIAMRIQLTINAINTAAMAPTPFGILYAAANAVATLIMFTNLGQ